MFGSKAIDFCIGFPIARLLEMQQDMWFNHDTAFFRKRDTILQRSIYAAP
jgi:hypothetical protein